MPVGAGWFVLNAREARWASRRARQSLTFTGSTVARRHAACAEEETQDADVAYAAVPKPEPTPYRDGWLPSS